MSDAFKPIGDRDLVALMAAAIWPHVNSEGERTNEEVAVRVALSLLEEVDRQFDLPDCPYTKS